MMKNETIQTSLPGLETEEEIEGVVELAGAHAAAGEEHVLPVPERVFQREAHDLHIAHEHLRPVGGARILIFGVVKAETLQRAVIERRVVVRLLPREDRVGADEYGQRALLSAGVVLADVAHAVAVRQNAQLQAAPFGVFRIGHEERRQIAVRRLDAPIVQLEAG